MNNLLRDNGFGCLGIDRHVNSLMIFTFLNADLERNGESDSIESYNHEQQNNKLDVLKRQGQLMVLPFLLVKVAYNS